MGLFSQKDESGDAVGIALMLGELRDMRGTMDKNDERLRGEIGGIKQSVADLSQGLLRSQGDMGAIRTDVDRLSENVSSMKEEVSAVKEDVQTLKTAKEIDGARWSGPKRVGVIIATIAAGLTGIGVIVKFGVPILMSFMPTPS